MLATICLSNFFPNARVAMQFVQQDRGACNCFKISAAVHGLMFDPLRHTGIDATDRIRKRDQQIQDMHQQLEAFNQKTVQLEATGATLEKELTVVKESESKLNIERTTLIEIAIKCQESQLRVCTHMFVFLSCGLGLSY